MAIVSELNSVMAGLALAGTPPLIEPQLDVTVTVSVTGGEQ